LPNLQDSTFSSFSLLSGNRLAGAHDNIIRIMVIRKKNKDLEVVWDLRKERIIF